MAHIAHAFYFIAFPPLDCQVSLEKPTGLSGKLAIHLPSGF